MSLTARVSVVIPTVDRIELLYRHALFSALAQEGVDVDVIVVCDGSPSHVVESLNRLGDARIRVIHHERGLGVSAARNAGIAAAEGAWIAPLDDDDLWAPTKLARLVEAATLSGAGFAYSSALIVDENLQARTLTSAPSPEGILVDLLQRNALPGGGSNLLIGRELARSVGGYDSDLLQIEDWDMAIRLASHAPAAAVPEALSAWYRHPRATAPRLRDVHSKLAVMRQKHAELMREYSVTIDERPTLYWVGNSELDCGASGYRLRAARAFGELAWIDRRPAALAHVGRALLGREVNRWLRERIRSRPERPAWLERFAAEHA